jgi:hypothetical protein
MKWTLTILIFLLLLLLSPMSGQETKITIQQQGSDKVQQVENWSAIGCTNGGHLHLAGDVRVAAVAPICTDSSCKETSPDKLTSGAHVPPGQLLAVYCTTKAEDEQANRDLEFCKNNVSNPRPESEAERNKWSAEISQCLKDRREFRRQKEH